MDIQRIAAFSTEGQGGNPAGVVLLDHDMSAVDMQRIAAQVGYSETAFALPRDSAARQWRVRYFSPESEVPFCGHATIALAAVLGQRDGAGSFELQLNGPKITVTAAPTADGMAASLVSPPTKSRMLRADELADALALFGLSKDDLDPRLPPAHAHGGADHLILTLRDRIHLARMTYDLEAGRELMRRHGLVTIMLVYIDETSVFSARNAFASGGVFEDPATGAAAAAFAGYLRDYGWPHGGHLVVHQGTDMGAPSRIEVDLSDTPGAPVQVSGAARVIEG